MLLVKFFHDRNYAVNNINHKTLFKVQSDPNFISAEGDLAYIQIRLYDAFYLMPHEQKFGANVQLSNDYRGVSGNSFLIMSFLSPEQRENERLSLKSNDIWAIGVMALYLYRAGRTLEKPPQYNQIPQLITQETAQRYLLSQKNHMDPLTYKLISRCLVFRNCTIEDIYQIKELQELF